MQKKQVTLNGIKVFPFISAQELLQYVNSRKGILIAINAEKILHATSQTRDIINRNIGYCDGYGAVMALKKKGYKNVAKIPGCELWLKITAALYDKNKTFYLVGSTQEVIEQTISKLKQEYPGIRFANSKKRKRRYSPISKVRNLMSYLLPWDHLNRSCLWRKCSKYIRPSTKDWVEVSMSIPVRSNVLQNGGSTTTWSLLTV